MPKINSLKFLSQMHFNLKNGKLEFYLKKDCLENKHYKTGFLLGTEKDAI